MSNTIGKTNLSSELLLNKIMNGSVQTESGKTVTMGSRVASSKLNLSAVAPSISSANVKTGSAQATVMQGRLSEMKDYLENLQNEVKTATLETAKSLGADATTYVNKVATTKVDGVLVFGTGKITVDMGFEESLELGAEEAGKAMTALGTAIGAAAPDDETKLAKWKTDQTKAIDTALKAIYDEMGASTSQIRVLDSRSAILDNIAETYVDAASNQGIVASGGANNLLNSVLS